MEVRARYRSGSTFLEKIIDRRAGIHIPHNVIQRILEEGGLAVSLKKRVKRRDWVR